MNALISRFNKRHLSVIINKLIHYRYTHQYIHTIPDLYIQRHKKKINMNQTTYINICEYCNGHGYLPCYNCSDEYSNSTPVRCYTCSNQGELECCMCGGNGKSCRSV